MSIRTDFETKPHTTGTTLEPRETTSKPLDKSYTSVRTGTTFEVPAPVPVDEIFKRIEEAELWWYTRFLDDPPIVICLSTNMFHKLRTHHAFKMRADWFPDYSDKIAGYPLTVSSCQKESIVIAFVPDLSDKSTGPSHPGSAG